MPDPENTELFDEHGDPIKPIVAEIIEDIERGETSIIPLVQQRTKEAIKLAQERIFERILAEKALKAAALTFTTAEDWVFHRAEGGDVLIPYLEDSGAEKLMHAFAIEIKKLSEERVVHGEDETYEIVIDGVVRAQVFSDIWYPETGSRWSGDGFFSRGGSVRIDPGDVRKSALTNFYNRCIKKVLGLRGLTKEDLEKVSTVDTNKIRIVTYRETGSGSKGGGGSVTDLMGGKHIVVFVPYQDTNNREAVKKVEGVRFHREEHPVVKVKNVWLLPYTEGNHKLAADLKADNSEIRFAVVDPAGGGGGENGGGDEQVSG